MRGAVLLVFPDALQVLDTLVLQYASVSHVERGNGFIVVVTCHSGFCEKNVVKNMFYFLIIIII